MEAGGRPGEQAGAGGLHLTSIHLAHWVDVNHKPDLIPFQVLSGAEVCFAARVSESVAVWPLDSNAQK